MNRNLPLLFFILFCAVAFGQKEKETLTLKGHVPIFYGSGLSGSGLIRGEGFSPYLPVIQVVMSKEKQIYGPEIEFDDQPRIYGGSESIILRPGVSYRF